MELKELVAQAYNCANLANSAFAEGKEEDCRDNLTTLNILLNEELSKKEEATIETETPESQ